MQSGSFSQTNLLVMQMHIIMKRPILCISLKMLYEPFLKVYLAIPVFLLTM